VTRLYLVRHGQTDWNASGRLQGTTDIPLNAAGRDQAERVADELKAIVSARTAVFASPLARAADTARTIADALGVANVTLDPRLAERAYGPWEGLTLREREERYPEAVEQWRLHGEAEVEGIEGNGPLARRVVAAIAEHTASAPDGLVVVSHGSAIRVGIHALLGMAPERRAIANLGNTRWSELVWRRGGAWSLERHNAGSD